MLACSRSANERAPRQSRARQHHPVLALRGGGSSRSSALTCATPLGMLVSRARTRCRHLRAALRTNASVLSRRITPAIRRLSCPSPAHAPLPLPVAPAHKSHAVLHPCLPFAMRSHHKSLLPSRTTPPPLLHTSRGLCHQTCALASARAACGEDRRRVRAAPFPCKSSLVPWRWKPPSPCGRDREPPACTDSFAK
ncbi:hypothetical protein B0H15DRAFT_443071 [Mycena belliarum]|uniref:Uncharacterized protein n=1 Tax=Mycena belliarum TaxID=1033014 RepID=A0AAD6XMR9_9AGAR|nr:hypothetical protein B0H15DRAFT_443071 [Mycena belliae]